MDVSSTTVSIYPNLFHRCPRFPASPPPLSSAARFHPRPCLPSPLSRISTAPHLPYSRVSVVCLRVSCVSAVSSVTFVSIIPISLPHHHPCQTRHLLCHCHCSPATPTASIVAYAFMAIVYFIRSSGPSNLF